MYIRATFPQGLGEMYYRVSIQAADCVKWPTCSRFVFPEI